MSKEITVTFKAIEVEDGNGPLDIRVLIPKGRYMLVAEDGGYYYMQPIGSFMPHASRENPDE